MLTEKQVKSLKVGDRIRWQYSGPDADMADAPAIGEITDSDYLAFRVQWDDGQGAVAYRDNLEFWRHVDREGETE